MEATVMVHQSTLGTAAWLKKALALTDKVGFGGVGELGGSFFDYDLGTTIATLITDADAKAEVTDCGPWLLTRVRLELWEATPERTAYVDSIEIDGVTYTIEPGGTAPGLVLSAPYTDVGYTDDGVTFNYTLDTVDVEVDQETFPINRRITKEGLEITCNLAESSLENINNAIAGSVLSGNILTLGDGALKTMSIKLTGETPGGKIRTFEFPKVTAAGAVVMSFKKDEKTVFPVTFRALKPSTGPVGTFVDNAV